MDEKSGTQFMVEDIGTTAIMFGAVGLPAGWQAAGIPLTPEVLMKCGFIPEGTEFEDCFILQIMPNYELRVMIEKDHVVVSSGYPGQIIDDHKFNHIQCLHQLQNLYYFWLGEELNYTPS